MTIDINRLDELLKNDGYERRYLSVSNFCYRLGRVEFRGAIDTGTVRAMTGWLFEGPRFTEAGKLFPTEAEVVVMLAAATTHQYAA
jgi:hypothetical protein